MRRPGKIKALTGLRGVAACFVMLYHTAPQSGGDGLLGTALRHGYLAVDLFFVLSGFVMALTYAAEFETGFSAAAYRRFLLRRIRRVYPLYLAVVLLCAALLVHGGAAFSLHDFMANICMVQAWGVAPGYSGPIWSISTEFAAYLLFPWLAAAVLFRGRAMAVLGAAAAVALLVFVATRSNGAVLEPVRSGPLDVYHEYTLYPLLRCLAGFTLGLFAWRAGSTPAIRRLAEFPAAGSIVAIAVLALLLVRNTDIAIAVLCIPLVIALAAERSAASAVLRSPVPYWLGVISYSIYLVHRPLADNLRTPLHEWLHNDARVSAVLVVLILITAPVTYAMIERPGRTIWRSPRHHQNSDP